MINLKFARNFSQQILVCCLLCIAGCSSIIESQKTQTGKSLVPKEIIEDFKRNYSPEEMSLINKDLRNIRETYFLDKICPKTNPIYVATAGGPGACKSTVLETYLHDKQNFVYVDSDQRTLKYMINTYYQSTTNYEISRQSSFCDVQRNAYTKWRDASNYIANTILNEAFAKGYNIAHGITSTTSAIGSLYKKLKQKNYKIILLLCYATDETRVNADKHRNMIQGFVQATPEDIINKGKMFPERFPIYFQYADEIHFYWTGNSLKGSILAAIYDKNQGIVIYNSKAMNHFIKQYDNDRKNLSNLPKFEEFLKYPAH